MGGSVSLFLLSYHLTIIIHVHQFVSQCKETSEKTTKDTHLPRLEYYDTETSRLLFDIKCPCGILFHSTKQVWQVYTCGIGVA